MQHFILEKSFLPSVSAKKFDKFVSVTQLKSISFGKSIISLSIVFNTQECSLISSNL